MICRLVTGVIQYFCFPERPIKVGTSWISRKGGILERGGGYDPPYQLSFFKNSPCFPMYSVTISPKFLNTNF